MQKRSTHSEKKTLLQVTMKRCEFVKILFIKLGIK